MVLFFGPLTVSISRLILGISFALHFNSHFSATKWKSLVATVRAKQTAFNDKSDKKSLKIFKTTQSNKVATGKASVAETNTEIPFNCKTK